MTRFTLLEHTGAPDDPVGRHFDLLLQVGQACCAWRLFEIPLPGGECVTALQIAPHRLQWLDHVAGDVSGGRGSARRIDAGSYEVLSADDVNLAAATTIIVHIQGDLLSGRLRIEAFHKGWAISLSG